MRFTELRLSGAYLIEPERIRDRRGSFARTWCAREFREHGLSAEVAQTSVAHNCRRGTIRGLHFHPPPHEETKLVRCVAGAIFDVIVDLRPESPTYLSWEYAILSGKNRRMLYVPHGFAHGYQTLMNDTEVQYQMSEFYTPGVAMGIRWNDPTLAIRWPEAIHQTLSDRDRALPLLPNAFSAVASPLEERFQVPSEV